MDPAQYPLVDALLNRRSRRFAPGMRLPGGPLTYASRRAPERLTLEEQAFLGFAACGVTGSVLADLPYAPGAEPETGGGNILAQLVGRTAPSGDALHSNTVFVLDDHGAWMLRRPQDFSAAEISTLVEDARCHRFADAYLRSRVHIADSRPDVPRHPPFVPAFNRWSANVAGTTYFVPVADLTSLYVNVLLAMFDDEHRYFVLDDRAGYQPAGVAEFARSRGGSLEDDPAKGRVATLGVLETWVCEFAAIEQGAIHQNLGLATQALGLGGFPHFAAHPFAWPQALGFRMGTSPDGMPTPLGLEAQGATLVRPWCPPWFGDMEEAVHAFVDWKCAPETGAMRRGGPWREAEKVTAGIPRPSQHAIDATVAYCKYVYGRYGRIPATTGPFRTILAYQAHRLDPDFYNRFYRDDAR